LKPWLQKNRDRLRRRWQRWQDNRHLMATAARVRSAAPLPAVGARPVIFFNASTRLEGVSLNAAFSLLSSWAVQFAGVPVIHFVCRQGLSRCVLGTRRDDPLAAPPCGPCQAQSRAIQAHATVRALTFVADAALSKTLQALTVPQLMTFEHQGVPLGALTLPALRWILRRHTLNDDEATRYLYRHFLLSAWNVAQQFTTLLDETNPQAVVVFNGQFYPEATARWVARQRGIPVFAHEVGLLPHTAYFTSGEATAYPIDIPASFDLSTEQNTRLDAYLEQRFQGNFSMAGIRFWPEMKSLTPEFWARAGDFKQIVPIFTNVIFDTSQSHANVVFSDMFAWLDAVLDLIRGHPETFFVLRAHPDESRPGKESRESVADWARSRQIAALPNVLFVDSGEPFSSYELIQKSKFVLIYNSTIGLEASILGAAVLCGGKARFTQLPTVYFPQTADEYCRQAEEFLAADTIPVPPEFQRNARRFLYYQLFRSSLPFDALLEDDGIWRGFVRLKPLPVEAFSPEQSDTLRIVVAGILHGGDFMIK
jgi:hypothetical protein